MTTDISNQDDVIDSRDVIARIEELQADIEESGASTNLDTGDGMSADGQRDMTSEIEELASLLALQEEAEGYAPDWRHGATLIRDSYFVDYCEELCKDIGDMPREIPHYIEIDWKKTAENIKVDYTSVEFDGVTYWVR